MHLFLTIYVSFFEWIRSNQFTLLRIHATKLTKSFEMIYKIVNEKSNNSENIKILTVIIFRRNYIKWLNVKPFFLEKKFHS
jgi:hypothetical protein